MERIRVLLVEPGEKPHLVEVDHSLDELQKLVGGYIAATYPWEDPVAVIVDDEGMANSMRLLGNILWIVFGGFLSALGWLVSGLLWCITILGMRDHLKYMREVGIDIIILQWSFVTVGDKVGAVYYDDSFDSSDKDATYSAGGQKLVENLLRAADELGMKVFLGLNNNDEWWQKAVNEIRWFFQKHVVAAEVIVIPLSCS